MLHRFGRPALAILGARPSPALLAAFLAVVAGGFVVYALRWRMLLAGLETPPALRRLVVYRAAGQSVSSLVPSAKLGGEPLRAYLLAQGGVSGASAIASVVVDRTLEMGVAAAFGSLFGLILLRRGVPALEGALATVVLSAVALAIGVMVAVRRLRRGAGLATALVVRLGLDRFGFVEDRIGALGAAEAATSRLIADPRRVRRAFLVGVVPALLNLLEYHLLLGAFGLPAGPLAVVAAIFATGAAHSLPVPGAVGTLEGTQMWLFSVLGHPPEVGLAVGLAVRLRELVWIAPGLLYLLGRGLTARSKE